MSVTTHEYRIDSYGSILPITVIHNTGPRGDDWILFIYGGTKTVSRRDFQKLARLFVNAGYSVCLFDFRGMVPGVNFYSTGLHTRVEDAQLVATFLQRLWRPRRLFCYATSMGGYIATHLEGCDGMILQAPAAYHVHLFAGQIPFGEQFRRILHSKGSWKRSDAFDRIARFEGKLLLLRMEHDIVVPRNITDAYERSARHAELVTVKTMRGFGHNGTYENSPDGEQRRQCLASVSIPWLRRHFPQKK